MCSLSPGDIAVVDRYRVRAACAPGAVPLVGDGEFRLEFVYVGADHMDADEIAVPVVADELAERVQLCSRANGDRCPAHRVGVLGVSQVGGVCGANWSWSSVLRCWAWASWSSRVMMRQAASRGVPWLVSSRAGAARAKAPVVWLTHRGRSRFKRRLSATRVPDFQEFGFESGLIRRSTGDLIRAVHNSFADYFAAVVYSRRVIEIPSRLTRENIERMHYLAELAGVDRSLASAVIRDLPFPVPMLVRRKRRNSHP